MVKTDAGSQSRGKAEERVCRIGPAYPTVVQKVGLSSQHPKVESLTEIIFRTAGESIQRYLLGSVDALSKTQLDAARTLLPLIEAEKQGLTPKSVLHTILDLIQQYYNLVPTVIPHRINDKYADIVAPFDPAEQENRLNQLEAALASHIVQATGTSQYSALGAELKWVEPQSSAYAVFKRAYHSINLTGVYLVKSPVNITAWESEDYGKTVIASLDPLKNAPILKGITPVFHGTRNPYVRHILRSGIRIPQVNGHVANGSRFGFGAYFADNSIRSAAYTQGDPRMMFVSDVALGTWKELAGDDGSLRAAPVGYHSVRGVKSFSAMDEWIIYRASQHRLMALVTF